LPGASEFRFELVRVQDLPMLHGWLLRPHVAQWWGPAESMDQLHADYVADQRSPGATLAYIASFDGAPVGFIQSYVAMGSGDGWWEDVTDPGVRGIDQFLAHGEQLNRGIGRAMVRSFTAQLLADPAVTLVQTDPSPDNARAIRCYVHAGFRPVGEIRTPDGPALLMHCTR
jgi:RimJ/RimL family protein N-acetyltransferase